MPSPTLRFRPLSVFPFVAAISLLVHAGCADAQPSTAAATEAEAHPFPRRVPAPSFDGGLEWFNTTKPLTLADLRGKFVLVDFWTFCCINCIHVLPELKQLERAYPNELVVVGVHSAKFEGEQDGRNIREAVLRYEIEHPVVNDANMAIWNRYGAQSWPTLVLIDPAGEAVWVGGGERKFEELRTIVERGLLYYRKHGLLTPGPATFIEKPKPPNTPLRFPGKVLADAAGDRLFIADSNHNRIVVTDFAGKLRAVVGSGEIGRQDGGFETATFHHPQGMALVGNNLYVADTENHLLRKIDLTARRVSTIAGTGEQGDGFPGPLADGRFGGPPATTPLNSPWALWVHGADLYIAMAGPHQIWRMPLDGSVIGPYAGNGREDIVDGPLLPHSPYELGFATFAQPSGLASDGTQLFVADSEGSAIRAVPFDPAGRVTTVVGVLGSLFDFGGVDGVYPNVRLQHPLGIVHHEGKLYVADTYNNKIKVVDPAARSCHTLVGTGRPGSEDAEDGQHATFNEPAGLSAAGDKLYVADTNSHAIRVVELRAPFRVTTLTIDGLAP
jgi:DNA-binding beta-propeller fold protein YncE